MSETGAVKVEKFVEESAIKTKAKQATKRRMSTLPVQP